MNEAEVLEMMKRWETNFQRQTEIVEAQNARMLKTLEEVRSLRLQMFALQTLAHEMKRAAGLVKI